MPETKAQKRKRTEEKVLRAYAHGANHKEASVILKKMSKSLHTKTRAQLVKEGRLSDLDQKRRGPGPHRWIPSDEIPSLIPSEKLAIESNNSISANQVVSLGPEKLPRSDPFALKKVQEIVESISDIHIQIAQDDAWRKRSEIRRICNFKIRLLLAKMEVLTEDTEYTITSTNEYFYNARITNITHWRGLLGRKIDIRGTIAVPAQGSSFELKDGAIVLRKSESCPTADGMIHPNLLDWMSYLTNVHLELASQFKDLPLDYKELYFAANGIYNSMDKVQERFYQRLPEKAR